ncbi:MAG: hypothetical protein IJT34_07310 [Butyrivibrio sp.]|nr:hypothetical protein [Butyrivibrio sp.]
MAIASVFEKVRWLARNYMKLRDYAAFNFYQDTVCLRAIRKSPLFDEAYYRRNHPEVQPGEDAAEHYLRNGRKPGMDPSEYFCSEEYLTLHCDVAATKMNPLLAYELYGRDVNYEISGLQQRDPVFPEGAVTVERVYTRHPAAPDGTSVSAIVACFVPDGRIPETLLFLLRGLQEVADDIVLVGDCPLFPEELDRLEGIVCYARFERHGQYDFGSYKRGLAWLRQAGLLAPGTVDTLLILNDSCYGPVYPFSELLTRMSQEACDFWGLNGYLHGKNRPFPSYISSNFYVFRARVVDSGCIDAFFRQIEHPYDRNGVILKLESAFTDYLAARGFLWRMVCGDPSLDSIYNPLTLLKIYRIPLVKKKAFQRVQTENMNEVMAILRANQPALAQQITYAPKGPADFRLPSIAAHRAAMTDLVRRLAEKAGGGQPIRVLFLTGGWDSFLGLALFKEMVADPAWSPVIAVIPDLRRGADAGMQILLEMANREKALVDHGVDPDRLLRLRPDHLDQWPDVCGGYDIVIYQSAQGYSCYRYLPKYAAGRDFLPVIVNDDTMDAAYDERVLRFDAYRYAWRVYFTQAETLARFQALCADGGSYAAPAASGEMMMQDLRHHSLSKTSKPTTPPMP